jgi:hypothetical protein
MTVLRWYHGGPRIADWNRIRWDRERGSSDLNAEGAGMYWTTDPDEAWGYTHGAPDPVVYEATFHPGFKHLPRRKPTMKDLRALFDYATAEDQEIFLSNWNIETPASQTQIDSALRRYSHQQVLFDAYVTLYHDLFRYDADAYVSALRSLGYDGYVLEKGTTGGSRRRKHLVLWQPRALDIQEIS